MLKLYSKHHLIYVILNELISILLCDFSTNDYCYWPALLNSIGWLSHIFLFFVVVVVAVVFIILIQKRLLPSLCNMWCDHKIEAQIKWRPSTAHTHYARAQNRERDHKMQTREPVSPNKSWFIIKSRKNIALIMDGIIKKLSLALSVNYYEKNSLSIFRYVINNILKCHEIDFIDLLYELTLLMRSSKKKANNTRTNRHNAQKLMKQTMQAF